MNKWMKGHKRAVIVLAVVVIVAAAVVTFVMKRAGKSEETPQEVKQNTIQLTKMDLTRSISATGTLESAKTKTVSADVSNIKIKKVLVEIGDEVKKGQSLMTFDTTDLKQTLDEAEENLSDVKTQNSTELAAAQKKLKEAKETYNELKKRSKGNDLTQSKSNVEAAKESLTSLKSSQKKSLREAQKSVDVAQEALDKCSVKASMSGTVTALGASAGDSYQGGDLVEISDCENLRVSTSVDEYDISSVEKGQKVIILTDATGEDELEGKITYVAPTTGSTLSSSGSSGSEGSGNTGSSMGGSSTGSSGYEVRIRMNSSNEKLRVGMTAKCSIILEEVSNAYAVPYDAIHTNTNGDSVLYVKDSQGTRSEVTVTKGMESDYYVEVTGDGLSENLQVIIPTDNASTSEKEESDADGFGFMQGAGGKNGNRGEDRTGGGPGGAPGGGPGGAPGM